jgi:hypothetical protein
MAAQPPFPGPSISNLPPRNLHFTGRTELLEKLASQLVGGAAVVAAHGLGGIGKTQLAVEYDHRHASDYDMIWWVAAESLLLATSGLAELAPASASQHRLSRLSRSAPCWSSWPGGIAGC